jgi:hypothetical protein
MTNLIEINDIQVKDLKARFNLFESRLKGLFDNSKSDGPVQRHELDQERLRYLGIQNRL